METRISRPKFRRTTAELEGMAPLQREVWLFANSDIEQEEGPYYREGAQWADYTGRYVTTSTNVHDVTGYVVWVEFMEFCTDDRGAAWPVPDCDRLWSGRKWVARVPKAIAEDGGATAQWAGCRVIGEFDDQPQHDGLLETMLWVGASGGTSK